MAVHWHCGSLGRSGMSWSLSRGIFSGQAASLAQIMPARISAHRPAPKKRPSGRLAGRPNTMARHSTGCEKATFRKSSTKPEFHRHGRSPIGSLRVTTTRQKNSIGCMGRPTGTQASRGGPGRSRTLRSRVTRSSGASSIGCAHPGPMCPPSPPGSITVPTANACSVPVAMPITARSTPRWTRKSQPSGRRWQPAGYSSPPEPNAYACW